jgi:hypothetical protein
MTEKLRIGFDLDGVLANFTLAFTTLAHEMFNTPIYPDGRCVSLYSFGLSSGEYERLWEYVNAHPEFWQNLPPLATPQEARRIRELTCRADVFFLTTRPEKGVQGAVTAATADWLCAHIGLEDPLRVESRLVVSENAAGKAKDIVALGLHVHIDDHPDLVGWPRIITIRYPYNDGNPNGNYVDSLSEYLTIVETLVRCVPPGDVEMRTTWNA